MLKKGAKNLGKNMKIKKEQVAKNEKSPRKKDKKWAGA